MNRQSLRQEICRLLECLEAEDNLGYENYIDLVDRLVDFCCEVTEEEVEKSHQETRNEYEYNRGFEAGYDAASQEHYGPWWADEREDDDE